jgi:hypothetical protein
VSAEQTIVPPTAVAANVPLEPEEGVATSQASRHGTRLRAGESVARVSGAGVVIRRAKRG